MLYFIYYISFAILSVVSLEIPSLRTSESDLFTTHGPPSRIEKGIMEEIPFLRTSESDLFTTGIATVGSV